MTPMAVEQLVCGLGSLLQECSCSNPLFLGVLMKPDCIEAGNQDKWFSLLQNQTESLEQGWFCIKLPDNEQLQQ